MFLNCKFVTNRAQVCSITPAQLLSWELVSKGSASTNPSCFFGSPALYMLNMLWLCIPILGLRVKESSFIENLAGDD